MHIVFAISEVEGLIKTGGLADVGKALSIALADKGHQVSVFLPYYQALKSLDILQDAEALHLAEPLLSQSHVYQFTLKRKQWQGVDFYFVDYPEYFDRSGLYGDAFHGYEDNGERFSFFSGAILHSLFHLNMQADLIHCHDWHTGVLPFLLRHNPDSFFANTHSVITIHNAAFQGVVRLEEIPFLRHHSAILGQVHGGYINMLQLGIRYADKITTVSPNYANELLTHLGSHGLKTCLGLRKDDLSGILNGCDYSAWNPKTDPYIAQNFDSHSIAGKIKCKQDLQHCFSLPESSRTPIIGMVCRLTDQKGFSYLLPVLSTMLNHNLQIVIAGTGDPAVCMQLNELCEQYPNRIAFFNGFSEEIAHKVEAGSDFFLMPSQFEPCGLNQMYSLAYGTLPIVRGIGGLKDTVVDLHENPENATGLVFYEPSGDDLLSCVRRALLFYHEFPDVMLDVQLRGMNTKFTWEVSTEHYLKLYQSIDSTV